MKLFIFSLLLIFSLNAMAGPFGSVVNPTEEYNPMLDPDNCFRAAHEVDTNNYDPVAVPLVIFDNDKTYIFSGRTTVDRGKEITVTMVTLQKYTRYHCIKMKATKQHATIYVAIGERVEEYSGFIVYDETFDNIIGLKVVPQLTNSLAVN